MAEDIFWDGTDFRIAWAKLGPNPNFEFNCGACKAGTTILGISDVPTEDYLSVDIRNSINRYWRHSRHIPFDQTDWFHIAQVFDGSTLSVYINGGESSVKYGPNGTRGGNLSRLMCLGGVTSSHSVSTGANWRGRIGPTAFWDEALSGADIAHHASATSLADYSSRVAADSPSAYWTLQESSGALVDQVGSRDFTPTGTPAYRQPGPLGGWAVGFDGSQVFTAADDDLWSATNFTMSAWIVPITPPTPGGWSVGMIQW